MIGISEFGDMYNNYDMGEIRSGGVRHVQLKQFPQPTQFERLHCVFLESFPKPGLTETKAHTDLHYSTLFNLKSSCSTILHRKI